MADLAQTPYPPLPNQIHAHVGLMIEQRATGLMRLFKRWAQNMRALTWDATSFGQAYDDVCYVPLNHDLMYRRFDDFIPEVIHFSSSGRFSSQAIREYHGHL